MATQKTVLIVDDEKVLREALANKLETWGFKVHAAKDENEMRRLADVLWQQFDVTVLDNQLDLHDLSVTGASIAIEYREKYKSFPPESIIYTSFDSVDYYRLAVKLGAAAYLIKDDLPLVVDHVKVLALRRALDPANPKLVAKLARLAAQSKSESDAIVAFCQGLLREEMAACLGVPFMILFTYKDVTMNTGGNKVEFPVHSAVYDELQALAHANLSGPSTVDSNKLAQFDDLGTAELCRKLNGAVLVPLSHSETMALSLAVIHSGASDAPQPPTDENVLCKVLSHYFRPTLLENLTNIWSQWTEVHAIRTSTAKLCLAVGQEISYGVTTKNDEQLQDLANDLSDTGQYLDQIDEDKIEKVSIKKVIDVAWKYVAPFGEDTEIEPPRVPDDYHVMAQKSGLELAISRLFQWFIHRTKTVPLNVKPAIKINCETNAAGVKIIFEDNSHRLPKTLRESLFAPFTQALSTPFPPLGGAMKATGKKGMSARSKKHQEPGRYLPLYLAKFLVESRYRGTLEDHSDEITEHNYGHRILMQFPISDS